MRKYIEPIYQREEIETEDIMNASSIIDAGQDEMENVSGDKGIFETIFNYDELPTWDTWQSGHIYENIFSWNADHYAV